MKKVIQFFQTTMPEPQAGGAMHLIALGLVLVLTLILCIVFHDAKESTFCAILISIWSVMFVMEVIKQVTISCTFTDDGKAVWSYDWGQFTLQLCDSPIYLLLPVALLKDGKLRDALSTFMATFILLGGIATYAFPASIYTTIAYHNVHTLVHHGLQIVSCLFIGVHQRRRLSLRTFGGAMIVFAIAVSIATIFNVGMHALYPDMHINMFFISPYFVKTVPEVVNEAWHKMHWFSRIMLYFFGLSALAFVIFLLYRLATRLFDKKAVAAAN